MCTDDNKFDFVDKSIDFVVLLSVVIITKYMTCINKSVQKQTGNSKA